MMLHLITGKAALSSFLRSDYPGDYIVISGQAMEALIEINPALPNNKIHVLETDLYLIPSDLDNVKAITMEHFVNLTLKTKICRTWSDT